MSEAHEKTRIRQLEDAAAHWEHKYANAREYNRNLEERCQKLEAALRTQPCARPMQPATEGYGYVTVAACIAAGNCGCDAGVALGLTAETACEHEWRPTQESYGEDADGNRGVMVQYEICTKCRARRGEL